MTQRPPHATDLSEHEDDDEGIAAEVNKTLVELSPWAISVAVHLLLVVAAVFLVWSTVLTQEEEPWSGEAAIHKAPQFEYVETKSELPSEVASRTSTTPVIPNQPTPSPILPTPGAGQPFIPAQQGQPGPPFIGEGPDDGPGPDSDIFGKVDRKTVFVIDASGSLIDTFPIVVNELKRLLSDLARAERDRATDPDRQREEPFEYALVFFRNGEVLVQDRRGLRSAELDTVSRSVDWLDQVHPGGATSPLPAIELALSYQPDTVTVLSDNITGHGQYELNADDLVARVLQVRGNRRVTINTVQFIYADPLEQLGQPGTLRRLAEETGGRYSFVTDRELNLR